MAIAKRAEAFSCPISYHSRTEKPETEYKYYPNVVELAANGGAGLDVFEHKPEVPEEHSGLDNVVLLPHVGSGTVETP
ncbi:hypothetical protein V6N13_104887 [Hibiscus sabdariffa]|uniref:D-isomer specific 2-hydroxyacid dehydrogenase NAD-binding domain-containing protein n=2 Tax=Hibiscus sabdariffa TaxID=183260 RepID=A0ABR1Z692_9ROSI